MKVCTDACLLGAWTADKMQGLTVKNVLDIGCGTGLLSLMLAQKVNTAIDAIEINQDASMQAAENISNSTWQENIKIIHSSLQNFISQKKYDLIICNPPFYEDDLRSDDENKNAAKHDTSLRLEELILFVKGHLNDAGYFTLLLPFHRTAYLEKMANGSGLFVAEKLLIKQSTHHEYFRTILLLTKNETATVSNELMIHDAERNYTPAFEVLLKDYYLKL